MIRRVLRSIFRWRWLCGVYLTMLVASWLWIALASPSSAKSGLNRLELDVAGEGTVAMVYQDSGPRDGPVVLMLHGSPGSHDDLKYLVSGLDGSFRCVVPDLAGYGQSQRLVGDYGTDAQAQILFKLLDTLNLERVAVVGFSYGSGVAISMAHQQPERIESLTLIGGMGVMEHEGSGDYGFEQFKYHVGYPLLVVLPEVIPHFGLLGRPVARHAFIRSFLDTDLRPVATWLEHWTGPTLILQGRDDFLVPDHAALAHHEIVDQSKLVMYDASHFMVFIPEQSEQLLKHLRPFLDAVSRGDESAMTRDFVDYTADRPASRTILPVDLNLGDYASPWFKLAVIMAGTWVLEDPTSIAVGLLIRDGRLDPVLGIMGIALGIFLGDLTLYLLGQLLGRTVLKWRVVVGYLPTTQMARLSHWFDQRGWSVVLVSRFIPGARLPVYLAAGALRVNPWKFAVWTFWAVLCWVPAILLIVLVLGPAAASPFALLFGESWLTFIGAVVVLLVVLRLTAMLLTWQGRRKLRAKIARLVRHEFWPGWVLYLCLLPVFAKLALKYRSVTVWLLSDPAVELGGLVGESKQVINDMLPGKWVLPSVRVGRGDFVERLSLAKRAVEQVGGYPVIVKPDAAYRGKGVKLVKDEAGLRKALELLEVPVMVQQYHAGPGEAGVFYMREPGRSRGWIFSITDKTLPVVEGDGERSLEDLIYAHPRLFLQSATFVKRLGERRFDVPLKGQVVPLGVAGNHAQGSIFRDGAHLITPELTSRVGAILDSVEGFYYGRLDVRYRDVEAFKQGKDFAIIELNAATSESTNIYDPDWSLARSLGVLASQWGYAFRFGDQVRREQGLDPPGLRRVFKRIWQYYRHDAVNIASD